MKGPIQYFIFLCCILTAGLLSCLQGCREETPLSISDLYWVEGEWKGRVEGGMMFEIWEIAEDRSILGETHILSGLDTVFSESMKIIEKDGAISLCGQGSA